MNYLPLGIITIENFWNEDLKLFRLIRSSDDIGVPSTKEFYNLKVRQVLPNVEHFVFMTHDQFQWGVRIITANDEIWYSNGLFHCQISQRDNWQVTIGVNGDSKTMYVAPKSSGSCSRQLIRIQ